MSEEITPLRKNIKKGLGRGLGSLLGENVNQKDDTGFERLETVRGQTLPQPTAQQQQSSARPPQHVATTAPAAAAAVGAARVTQAAAPSVADTDRIWRVAIEKIVTNKEQPRKQFDQAKLQELANSIKEKGILQPIVARRTPEGKFEIVAGERRWRAAQLAGAQEVPIILKNTDNREALELALIENIQRHDLNPIEESESYQLLANKYGLTQQLIAEKVGKDRSTVANLMRLSSLAAEVKQMIKQGELQLGHAKALLSIADPKLQTLMAKRAAQLGLSVRSTERMVAQADENGGGEIEIEAEAPRAMLTSQETKMLTAEIQSLLGTKVEISTQGKNAKVAIQFYSLPEINQFIEKLRKLRG